jgi:hypothetical protein
MRHTNAHLSFVTKAGSSLILNKLRDAEKPCVSVLPSIVQGARVGDVVASRFTRLETFAYGTSLICIFYFSFLRSVY